MDLLIGAGSSTARRVHTKRSVWVDLVTLDYEPSHRPDITWDLREFPYPFGDNTCEEIHAYEILEHIGQQGDYHLFFRQFQELWRILKPNGYLAGTCPSYRSQWAWGDPGHTRVITAGSLVFLDQIQYERQVGVTPMSDYRSCYAGDFCPVRVDEGDESLVFVLHAMKPSRARR